MKKYIIKKLLINLCLLFSLFVFGCSSTQIKKADEKTERYSCQNYEFSVALIEMVDEETNGKIYGATHFHSNNGNEIFYSYQRYNSNREAFDKFKEEQKEADKILEETELMNDGKAIGKKVVFYAEKEMSFGVDKNYYLLWTKESLLKGDSVFYWIRSKSLAGIEEMKKECNF